MTAPTREQVIVWAKDAGFECFEWADGIEHVVFTGCEGPVTDELERFAALVAPAVTRKQHIDALVGDALTGRKASEICERDGYAVTGVVLTLPDGRACIVNRSAVRWLHGETDLWNLMFTDSGLNQRLINEAVAAEREACAAICDAYLKGGGAGYAAAIRARGEK